MARQAVSPTVRIWAWALVSDRVIRRGEAPAGVCKRYAGSRWKLPNGMRAPLWSESSWKENFYGVAAFCSPRHRWAVELDPYVNRWRLWRRGREVLKEVDRVAREAVDCLENLAAHEEHLSGGSWSGLVTAKPGSQKVKARVARGRMRSSRTGPSLRGAAGQWELDPGELLLAVGWIYDRLGLGHKYLAERVPIRLGEFHFLASNPADTPQPRQDAPGWLYPRPKSLLREAEAAAHPSAYRRPKSD